ncbi:tandem-95 repeat protein [Zhongshania marina]|uniref:Bacterial Ig-like domain-containing protein n=1 Tax=Zhongshania marina TaxID=2304603 RepID=A0A2S4HF87_9GAMM|nr:tandem-95 repeat protein [Marortus luteolus]POP52652.1 hypothetical protein C0068_10615 [Marortus luteolus]
MDTPTDNQQTLQTKEGLPLELAAASQTNATGANIDDNDALTRKKEQDLQDDEKPEESPANQDAIADGAKGNINPEQLDSEYTRPRPVSDYLKDDDSLPGWVWTLAGVTLIGGLDALDDGDSNDSDNTPNNTAPQFSSSTLALDPIEEDGSATFTLDVEDADGDSLSFSNSNPSHGTITQGDQDEQFIYTPDDNFFGDDSFIILARDPSGATDSITVSVTVTPINDAPQVEASQELGTKAGIALAFDVDATDIEEDPLTYSVGEGDNAPQNGTVDVVNSNGNFTYTPNEGFIGEDSFQIIVSDGDKESTQTVTINVRGTQTATADDVSVYEGAENTTAMVFTINIDSALAEDIILNVSKTGGTASEDTDFSTLTDTVTLLAGQTSVDYVVNIIGDTENEGDETLELSFDSSQLAAPLSVTGTIINDDPQTVLTLNSNDDSGTSNDDGITQLQALTLTVTSATGANVEIFANEQSLGMATEDSENPGTYHFLTTELDEGSYLFSATVTQSEKEPVSSAPISVTVDLSKPTLTEFNASADDDTVTLTFSEAVDFLDATGITFQQDDTDIAAVLDSVEGNTATFSFETDLVSGSLIDVAIADNSVSDLAGNLLTAIEFAADPNAITV